MVNKPVVMVAASDPSRMMALASAVPMAELVHVADAEGLLRETHLTPPDVVLLYTDLPSRVPLHDVLGMLRGREDLVHTRWLAVGTQGLGPMLQAGADALMSDNTPTEAMASQVRTLLERVRQTREQTERMATLQRRMDTWEHEERVRDQLVHMLVHDLKNPIAAVLGLLEVVEDDADLSGESRELVKLAREETYHLLHLSVNMLDVRKIQAGKMKLNTELVFAVQFTEVIEQARGDVGVGMRERHLRIQVPGEMPPVVADPEILRRIYANLLSNAMKHTTTGGVITLRAQVQGNELLCAIHDDGEGIPAEDIPNLFAAFEQSRLTLHGRFDTGMGLAFCKLAVEGHGGRIWVESERGKGASFYFTLPLAMETEDDDFADLLV
ncbi:sensor histidine kinase [Deinococcus ruber]|uniref:histidine kinase n=2 Tax=Deinococcus ruber TaxID=1848197 RepID=A0A918BX22_9DEIO|nr:sensor histidine kinase [Deinococcus ruber]